MAKSLPPAAAPYDQLSALADDIDGIREQLRAKIRERNAGVVQAVDEGWPQERIAKAIRVGPTAVIKILAAPAAADPPAA